MLITEEVVGEVAHSVQLRVLSDGGGGGGTEEARVVTSVMTGCGGCRGSCSELVAIAMVLVRV